MNPKISKLRAELEKNTAKIDSLQKRNREIKEQVLEMENTDIIGMVRESGMSIEEFAVLFQQMRSVAIIPEKKEDSTDA